MDYEKWIKKANTIIETKVEYNKPFELKSLFPEYEWNMLSRGEKCTLGRLFSLEVGEGKVKEVSRWKEAKNKHNQYVKNYSDI